MFLSYETLGPAITVGAEEDMLLDEREKVVDSDVVVEAGLADGGLNRFELPFATCLDDNDCF